MDPQNIDRRDSKKSKGGVGKGQGRGGSSNPSNGGSGSGGGGKPTGMYLSFVFKYVRDLIKPINDLR